MEIYLDKRAVKHIRISAADAIEEGDTEALHDDLVDAFPVEMVEMLEQMLAGADFSELVAAILGEWSGDDVDELFELLESQLSDHGVDLKYYTAEDDEDDEDDEEDDDEYDDEEYEDDDFDDYDEPGIDDDI